MASKIKSLSLGCAAAALLGSAQAAPVTLDFERLGIAAPRAGTRVLNYYATTENFGVTFSANALAQHNGLNDGNDVEPPPKRAGSFGYVRNARDCPNCTFSDLTISFAANTAYSGISLDLATGLTDNSPISIEVFFDAFTSKTHTQPSTAGQWFPLDLVGSSTSVLGKSSRPISSVVFHAGNRFAIDNLVLTGLSGGSTVPEPAGFGLVTLALAGAGLASRRNRKV